MGHPHQIQIKSECRMQNDGYILLNFVVTKQLPMNKTMTISFKITLIFLGLLLIKFPAQTQSITIDYIPPEAICSFDTLGCTGSVSIHFSLAAENEEGISVLHQISLNGEMPINDIYGSLSGVYPGYIISGNYPIGQHSFVVTAIQESDTLVENLEFSVVDCVAPSSECVSGVSVILLPLSEGGCEAKVAISEFYDSVSYDCTEPLHFAVHEESQLSTGVNPLEVAMDSVLINCDFEEVSIAYLYVWDNTYNPYAVQPDGAIGGPNYSYCLTYVQWQSWVSHCCLYDESTISGTIKTEQNEGIEGVDVLFTSEVFVNEITDENGQFEFSFFLEFEVSITPSKNDFPTNGVTVLDQILIHKHILGNQTLDSPYKLIAADVNHSETISILDIIHLKKTILGIYDDFPNSDSWRFIDASYTFPNPADPWQEDFPEIIFFEDPNFQNSTANFIGIKIGDVNGSSTPNN